MHDALQHRLNCSDQLREAVFQELQHLTHVEVRDYRELLRVYAPRLEGPEVPLQVIQQIENSALRLADGP